MANQRFWFPGLEKKLTKVVWKVAGGLIYIHIEWLWGLFPDPHGPPSAEPTYPGSPAGSTPPNPYLITIENLPGYDSFPINVHQEKRGNRAPAPTIDKPKPEIEDPVTTGMLGYYVYWTPPNSDPAFSFTNTVTTPGFDFLVLDTANWTLVYAGHITSRQTVVMTKEAALNEFIGLIGSTGYEDLDPNLMGVAVVKNDYSDYTQYELEQIVASGVWSGHYETVPGSSSSGSKGSGNLIINVAQVQRELTPAQKSANRWTFDITMQSDQFAQPIIQASAFPASKEGEPNFEPRKTFPVAPIMHRPYADDADSFVEADGGGTGAGVKPDTRFRVTVQIKPLKLIAIDLISGGFGADIIIG